MKVIRAHVRMASGGKKKTVPYYYTSIYTIHTEVHFLESHFYGRRYETGI